MLIVTPVPPTLALRILNATAFNNTSVLAQIGSLLSISCEMTAAYTEGNLQVYWLAGSGISDIPTMRPSQTEVQLTIDEVDKEDEDTYICIAINDQGSDLLSVNLIVGTTMDSANRVDSNNNATVVGTVVGICFLVTIIVGY